MRIVCDDEESALRIACAPPRIFHGYQFHTSTCDLEEIMHTLFCVIWHEILFKTAG